jgi:predicted enzyme related to lactoylglutathione lyase
VKNALTWFELFVTDIDRAAAFYEVLLHAKLRREVYGGEPHAVFPDDGLTGALVLRANRKPSADGAIVYLNCDGILDECLTRVKKAGGTLVMPKTDIGPPGHIALVVDTEGNVVGLHARRAA